MRTISHPTGHRRSRTALAGVVLAGALTGSVMIAAPAAVAAPAPKVVYLTFDDGPGVHTPKVLDLLKQHGAKATFYQTGANVTANPATAKRAHREGHSVQNHTWSHVDLRTVSWSKFKSEVTRTDTAIRTHTGKTPTCLRPPYGAVNQTVRDRAAALRKGVRLWSVDTRDWARPGRAAIESRVLNNVRNGSVVLLHDGGGDRSQTVAALPKILKTLKSKGYTFGKQTC
ncbi:polysaccharide deacetylase family protein [Streptomyces uncialis]|uniref:polysaccharide deacetylase family protein n=1 Tax=Streptomyces uncialis TaxID=1048205 RepID=UPI0009A10198|nr:polysaccharide deacetylase family protein [Streptomyces uncialis]